MLRHPLKKSENDPSAKAKILLIEDEELIRELYADVLQNAGFDLIFVETGEEGLKEWRQNNFNLLITDIGLPGISGWEVIESIREKNLHVPIIIVTGWGNRSEAERGESLKVNHVLSKPIDLFNLTSLINDCLQPSNQYIS